MKSKKTLGGLVAVGVLLSGTTVLYFAGVERVGVAPATAVPPGGGDAPPIMGVGKGGGGDCADAGGFCADSLGFGGGCNSRPCCPEGQTYCGSDKRSSARFQEIGSPRFGSLGTCWTYTSHEALSCILTQCYSPGHVCPSSACVVTGNVAYQFHSEPVPVDGASCRPKA